MKVITDQEHKALLLDMVIYLAEVCKENNLRFFLEGGTLIGQVRHHGFIPWDDDFDIAMFRDEYEQLCQILSNNKPYRIITHENSKGYSNFFAKLVDTRTKITSPDYYDSEDLGVFIDIFPLDKVPISKLQQFFYFNRIWYLRKISIFTILKNVKISNPLFLPWLIFKRLNRIKIIEKANRIAKHYNSSKSTELTNILGSFKKYVLFPADYYSETIYIEFEKISLPAPVGFDSYLQVIYGDYMQLPPLEERIGHHDYNLVWRED